MSPSLALCDFLFNRHFFLLRPFSTHSFSSPEVPEISRDTALFVYRLLISVWAGHEQVRSSDCKLCPCISKGSIHGCREANCKCVLYEYAKRKQKWWTKDQCGFGGLWCWLIELSCWMRKNLRYIYWKGIPSICFTCVTNRCRAALAY